MRSPLAALAALVNRAPVPYVGSGARSMLPVLNRSSREAQLAAMGSVGTLFAIVARIQDAVSGATWRLYRSAPSGDPEERQEVTSHAVLDLWERPNPWQAQADFVATIQQHLDLTGEAWWVVVRAGTGRGLPLELWPVRPDRIEPVPHPTRFVTGYVYHGPDGEKIPLRVEDVIRLRIPHPLDIYRGMGPVQAMLADIDSARYSAEWNRNFFLNSAEPGGLIQVEKRLSDAEFDELRDRWNEQHRGVVNAHRVAILEQGQWVSRTFTMRDMQFAELRRVSRDVIMEAFGFPRSMLGIVEDVNRANAEASEVMFARWLVRPRLRRIRDALNRHLLPMYATARGLEIDFDDPVPEDRELEATDRSSRATAVAALVNAGYDPADAAEAMGLPPMGYRQPPPPQPPPGSEPARPEQPDVPAAPEGHAHHLHHLRAQLAELPTPPEGIPARDVESVEAVDLEPVQAAWRAALVSLLATWTSAVIPGWVTQLVNAVRSVLSSGAADDLPAVQVDTGDAATVLTTAMGDLARRAARRAAAEVRGLDLDPADVDVGRFAEHAALAARLDAGRFASAAATHAAWVHQAGRSADEVAEAVREHLDGLSAAPSEARLGAALTYAQNTARLATFTAGGPEISLYASERLDTNTCAPCRAVHGRWLALASDLTPVALLYPSGGYIDCLGRHRCRGTIVAVWRPGIPAGGDQ